MIDLGYECDIESVVLVTRKNSEAGRVHTANITLELSNDPEFLEGNYITIGTTPEEGTALNKDFVVKLAEIANYRYVRAIKYSGDNYVAIPEIEVYTKDSALKPKILQINTEGENVTAVTLRADTTVAYETVLLTAVYNNDGRLVNVVIKDGYKPVRNSSEQTVNISGVTVEDGQYAAVMLWDNLENINPQMNIAFSE